MPVPAFILRTIRVAARARGALFGFLLPLMLVSPATFAESAKTALGDHVPALLARAAKSQTSANTSQPDAAMTVTLVLRRDDEAGFQRYLHDVQDAGSPTFRRFLAPADLADRFGPSTGAYGRVVDYLQSQHLALVEGSANRLTLIASGARADIERAFAVSIQAYEFDGTAFFANDADPSLPADIAPLVQSIAGLSDVGRPYPMKKKWPKLWSAFCGFPGTAAGVGAGTAGVGAMVGMYGGILGIIGAFAAAEWGLLCYLDTTDFSGAWNEYNSFMNSLGHRGDGTAGSGAADGSGQTIGLLQFDTFETGDVADFLAYIGQSPSRIGQLSRKHVNGGASAGADQDEVLLDIDTVMAIARGADVVVYDAPFDGRVTSYAALFNAMINDGVDIISNSWASCEDQVSLAEAQGIDSVLQSAAASGISVFNAVGDSGSTCLDGRANTISVPADSPNATAVGGTTLHLGPGLTYAGETWWDGSADTPSTGQGGFGVSRFFARPAYQNGLNANAMRSVPDVAIDADPATGMPICQAADGGCPNGNLYGGTSLAAPQWAAYTALLRDALGTHLGAPNPHFYPLAHSTAFHGPASMGSDFAHVGLGSPNVNALFLALGGDSAGTPTADRSTVIPLEATELIFAYNASSTDANVPADGATTGGVLVLLRDANGNSVAGKTVTLAANAGSHAVITPASGVSSADNGAVVFTITDNTLETLTLTATDTTDGIVIGQTAEVNFVAPSAAGGGILAFPTVVAANGADATTITITLRDAQNRPSPGKSVTIAQNGRSVIVAPDPAVTNANGEIAFTATDAFEETVTYTAVDESDGELPIPGSATVTFSGSAAGSCVTPPIALGDYAITPFVNGFAAYPFFYGNTNFGCYGASDAAFDTVGNAYVLHAPTGNLYKLGPDGGSATTPLSTLGPTLHNPVFDTQGRLYAAHSVTTGDFRTGDIVEIDPVTGAQLRVVGGPFTCPNGLAFDPISGDLFFDDSCSGAGSDDPSVFRISDPSGTDPNRPTAVSVYATLPSTPNGLLSFAPDGTLYAATAYGDCQHSPLVAISATDGPSPPTTTTLTNVDSCYWLRVGAVDANGAARSLLVFDYSPDGFFLNLVDITTTPALQTPLARNLGTGSVGGDGCLYTSGTDTLYKLTPADGVCHFAATNPSPSLELGPRNATPNPAQGSTRTLTATFRNVVVPADAAVYFQVTGANAQTHVVRAAADGTASFTLAGTFAGDDVIVASATLAGDTLLSNPARITWTAGPHTTFIGSSGAEGADAGQPIDLTATLVDLSLQPHAGIGGATLAFAVDGHTCTASTDANGKAHCSVTLATTGVFTLTVTYAGSAQYLPATQSTAFVVGSGIDRIFADGFDGGP